MGGGQSGTLKIFWNWLLTSQHLANSGGGQLKKHPVSGITLRGWKSNEPQICSNVTMGNYHKEQLNKTPSAFVCDLTEVSYSKTERAVVVKGALLILTPDLSHALPLLCGPLVAPRCQFWPPGFLLINTWRTDGGWEADGQEALY